MASNHHHSIRTVVTCVATAAVFAMAGRTASAGVPLDCSTLPTVDGRNLQTRFGGAVNEVQNNPTGFGDQAPDPMDDSQGSELDQLFLGNDSNFLFIGITGNTPRVDTLQNTVIVFIDVGNTSTTPILNTADLMTDAQALIGMDGIALDFAPDYALAVWNDAGVTNNARLHDLTNPMSMATTLTEGVDFALDNSNLDGVNAEPASDPLQQEFNAATATTGVEFKIALSALGFTTPLMMDAPINIQAIIVNNLGFVSNQSLPPLNPTNVGVGGGVECLGIHDPGASPPNVIDMGSFSGSQFVGFTLDDTGVDPGVTLDGANIPGDFNSPTISAAATQNNFTCFEDAAEFSTVPSAGSEINELYVTSDGAKLYIGIPGNVPVFDTFNNTIVVFLDIGNGSGSNIIVPGLTGGSGAVSSIGLLTLQSGFAPRFAIQYWRQNGQHMATIEDLAFDNPEIPLEFTTDPSRHLNPTLNAFGVNLDNLDGVNNIPGDDPQEDKAATAQDGVQFSIRLAGAPPTGLGYNILGDPGIKVVAAVISGSGFISNQWLPPLRKTTGATLMSNDTVAPALEISDGGTIASGLKATDAAANLLERVTGLEVTVNITHPAMEQLDIDLFHPRSGRNVRLWEGDGTGANMSTTFVNGGTSLTLWAAPGAGMFDVHDPVNNSLLTFNDVDPTDDDPMFNEWILFVTDNTSGMTGTLDSWSLKLFEEIGGGVDCIGDVDEMAPLSIATEFPTSEVITYSVNPGFEDGAPSLDLMNPPGVNIPDVYPTPAKTQQNNHTCFGDAQSPGLVINSGNEMDQLFIANTEDRLQIAITGNLVSDSDGNAFVLLFDTVAGGSSTLPNDLPTPPRPIGGNPDNPGENGLSGMVLDAGFEPDFALSMNEFFGGYVVDFVNLTTGDSFLRGFQDFNSGSGELRPPDLSGGSELNQLFVQNDADNLYIGLTGNLEGNRNGFVVFLDTVAGGSTVLNTMTGNTWPDHLVNMHDDTLSDAPEYAVVVERDGALFPTAKLVDLTNLLAAPDDIAFATDFMIASNTFVGNNENVAGVNALSSDDPGQQAINAATATTGIQFAISRTSIGLASPGGNGTNIGISAVLISSTGFWSNQLLPGAGGGLENLSFNPGDPGNPIDPVNVSGVQSFAPYTISATPSAPSQYDGADIPTAMSGGVNPLATQNNFTQFGNQIEDPRFNNDNCTQVAFDNSNVLGVTGCDCVAPDCLNGSIVGADAVDTGFELDIALADLGLGPIVCGSEPQIRVLAVLTNNVGFVSNQLLPGIGGGGPLCNLEFAPDLTMSPGTALNYTLAFPCGCDDADIDGDGDVDIDDATALVEVLLGINAEVCALQKANVNGDLEINGLDIQAFVDALP